MDNILKGELTKDNLNESFGPSTRRLKRRKVKKTENNNSTSRKNKLSNNAVKPTITATGQFTFPMAGGPGRNMFTGPSIINGKFVFPGLIKEPSPKRSSSKHNSYLTKGTVTADEIIERTKAFIAAFFKEHDGDTLNVEDILTDETMKDILKYMKPLPKGLFKKDEKIGDGGFGDAFVAADPTKIVKTINFYNKLTDFFNVKVSDIISEALIQYIIQTDPVHPEFVPAIHGIYYSKSLGTIYIVMDRLDTTLDEIFSKEIASFSKFKGLIEQVLEILVYLNKTYGFVHRDLKGNNIMVKTVKEPRVSLRGKAKEVEVSKVRLIDFGFSAMNLEYADGRKLRISSSHSFTDNSPCRGRQDTYLLFFYFNGKSGWFDAKTRSFLDEILEPMRGRSGRWNLAYNRDGTLLACPTTRILDPPAALRHLQRFG